MRGIGIVLVLGSATWCWLATDCAGTVRRGPIDVRTEAPPSPSTELTGAAQPIAVAPASAGSSRPTPPAVTSDWCTDVFTPLDEDACYLLPERPTSALMVYLHGIVPPDKVSDEKTHFESVVAKGARLAGVAMLLPRGQKGLAPRGRETWIGWPTTPAGYDKYAAAMVVRFGLLRNKLEQWLGQRFEKTYLAGSSSGAYFVSRLAMHGDFPADGFGALSGGSVPEGADPSKLVPKPFYVGYGEYDSAGHAAGELAALLRAAGWPVRESRHPVGHGAREFYIEEAVAFFETSLGRTEER